MDRERSKEPAAPPNADDAPRAAKNDVMGRRNFLQFLSRFQ